MINIVAKDDFEAVLLSKAIKVELRVGEYLFNQNEYPSFLYWIDEGKVLHEKENGSKEVLQNQEFFGLKELLQEEPYHSKATAVHHSKVMRIHKDNILMLLAKNKKWVLSKLFQKQTEKAAFE